MLDQETLDQRQTAERDDGRTSSFPAPESIETRVALARSLVKRACGALEAESPMDPFELRLTRALAMNLLDELSALDRRGARK